MYPAALNSPAIVVSVAGRNLVQSGTRSFGLSGISPGIQSVMRLGLYFATDPKDYFDAAEVVGFMRDLLKHLRGGCPPGWPADVRVRLCSAEVP